MAIAMAVLLLLSLVALAFIAIAIVLPKVRVGGQNGCRSTCPAITGGLMSLLGVQILAFAALVEEGVLELVLAFLVLGLACILLGRRIYVVNAGLAMYWWGIRMGVIRFSEVQEVTAERIDDTGVIRQVLLHVRGALPKNILGYDNIVRIAEIAQENGVPVAMEEVHEAARLRYPMWGLVAVIIAGLLLLNGLWAAGIIELTFRRLSEPIT